LARCLSGLPTKLRLLIADPTELGHCIGAGHFRARPLRRDKRDTSARRMHREVNMFDALARHGDGDLADLDRLCHQYPGWFLMISKSAAVASRSRLSSGNRAFSTCAS